VGQTTSIAVSWIKAHRTAAASIATGIVVVISIASVADHIRRKYAEFVAHRFESAGVAELAESIPRLDVSDSAVVAWLDRLYQGRNPDQKLAAALVLAPIRGECENDVFDRSLNAEPRVLGSLTPVVEHQVPRTLIERLLTEVRSGTVVVLSSSEAELRDRRRANVACALFLLGHDGPAWQLLRSAPDPQARSFLMLVSYQGTLVL
jgi:hypothetical protein